MGHLERQNMTWQPIQMRRKDDFLKQMQRKEKKAKHS